MQVGRLSQHLDTIARRGLTRWDTVFRAIANIEALPAFACEQVVRLS